MAREYFGYGFICTKNENVNIKATPAYKKLRTAFIDKIHIDIGRTPNENRTGLFKYIDSLCTEGAFKRAKGDYVIVFPSIESLGKSATDAGNNAEYLFILNFNIIILDNMELSSCDFKDNQLIQPINEDLLITKIACASYARHGKRGNAIDVRFRIAYWAWQNYFVETNDAIKLSGMSGATFYLISTRYRTEHSTERIYNSDLKKCLFDPIDKPIRGTDIGDFPKRVLTEAYREYGEYFSYEEMSHLDLDESLPIQHIYDELDIYREKNKFIYGRGAFATAMKKYNRGSEYVEILEERIREIESNNKSNEFLDLSTILN